MFSKKIAGNFLSLTVAQGLNYLFPLIVFPVLLRKLGVEGFGIFTLIQTLIMYSDLLVSFGFGLTATRQVSHSTGDHYRISRIVSAVYIIKTALFLLPLMGLLVAYFFIPFLQQHFFLMLIAALYPLGNLLFPDWYFQGIQKMRSMTIVTLVSKFISLVLVFWWVKNASDIDWAIASVSVGNLIAGVIGFLMMQFSLKPQWLWPGKRYVSVFFKETSLVFSSIILVPLYSSVNLFILQAFTDSLMVGYYAISEKIFNAISMLTSIANRTFFPHLSSLFKHAASSYLKEVRKISVLFLFGFILLGLGLFLFAGPVMELLGGAKLKGDMQYAVVILQIMSLAVVAAPFGSFYFQLMIIQGQKKSAMLNIIYTIIINAVTACSLSYFFSGKGMAVNLCLIVFLVGLFNFYSWNRKARSLS